MAKFQISYLQIIIFVDNIIDVFLNVNIIRTLFEGSSVVIVLPDVLPTCIVCCLLAHRTC